MVLYYGLLALETANNTVASGIQINASKTRPPIERRSSSANSWIYTEDLRKRFEERFINQRCIVMPVHINEKQRLSHRHSENAWIYSKSLHDHFVCSKSSTCSVNNQVVAREPRRSAKNHQLPFSVFRSTNTQHERLSNLSIKQDSSNDDGRFPHKPLSRIPSDSKTATTQTTKFLRLRSLFLKPSSFLSETPQQQPKII